MGPARIAGGKKQHFDLIIGSCFLFAKRDNCLRFYGFVAGAAFGVKKVQQLLKSLGVAGVPEEGTLPADFGQILVLKLFQLVRKS